MSTSTSQTKSTVPFAHTAAGHAGISTSANGTLLIKPCVPAEITFYESARLHPNFQAHMPVYMGSLTLNDSPEEQVATTALRDAQTRRDSKGADEAASVAVGTTDSKDAKGTAETGGHIVTDPKIESTPTKQWTPSGGAKLTSNLSIVLSNATAGFSKPNIIDLKLGARLWDDNAPVPKRKKLDEVSESSTSTSLGFRVAGMKVFVGDEKAAKVSREINTSVGGGYKTFDKMYGRSNMAADGSNIDSAFEEFLWSLTLSPKDESDAETIARVSARRKLLVQRILREIESVQFVLENEESRMYSASILIVYEGDPDALNSVISYNSSDGGVIAKSKPGVDPLFTSNSIDNPPDQDTDTAFRDVEEAEDMDAVDVDEDEDDEQKQKIHEVVMIDFAHAKFVPGEGPDENALKGVRSIRRILEGLLG